MKTIKFVSLGMLMVVLLSLGSCGLISQAREMDRFVHCNFTINSVALERVAGVDISHVKGLSDLNFNQMIALSTGLLNGKLPTDILLNIEVNNPSSGKAAVSGLDWKLLQKKQVIATGQVNKPMEVKRHASKPFDIQAKVNLVKVFQLNSMSQIIRVMSGNLDAKTLQKLGLTIQLKPYYKLDGKVKKYPGYLTITPNFGN